MSRVIATLTFTSGVTIDITRQDPTYGNAFGWSSGPGPNQDGCTGFDTIGQAIDGALEFYAAALEVEIGVEVYG